jgi:zinc transport system substrate-binding protein
MILMKLLRGSAVALAVLGLALTGCSSSTPAASTPGRLAVTASFYPFEFVADRIGGDLVSVTNLTAPGSEPHDLELTPRQVAGLAEAGLVIYQKGFQPAVDAAVQTVPPRATVDAAAFLTLETLDEEDGHAADDGHDHGSLDPHTWLDPANMVTIAEHVRDALAAAEPSSAATFEANAKALIADLTTLDSDYTKGLQHCTRTVFITSHEAFGYLARRYHLHQVGIRGIDPDTEPTASRIAEVQQIARDNKVTTIFFETLASPVVATSIAGDLGLLTGVLDPIEGITADSQGADYLEVMRSNLAALRKANGCS